MRKYNEQNENKASKKTELNKIKIIQVKSSKVK